jgi:hypothetical protein
VITEKEKNIYNTYLATSKSCRNKPFKLRKDFSTFTESENYIYIQKLSRFFEKHRNIKMLEFFKAPFVIHPEEEFHLDYFIKPKAVGTYLAYLKSLDALPWDDDYHLNNTIKSLKFIKNFCLNNKFKNFNTYLTYTQNNMYPEWFIHAKERLINYPTIHGFDNVLQIVGGYDLDIISLFIGDFKENYYSNKFKFKGKIKNLVQIGIQKIDKLLVENANNTSNIN